jgi:hypothetical protein
MSDNRKKSQMKMRNIICYNITAFNFITFFNQTVTMKLKK